MTRVFNDPAEFAEDSLDGYVRLYPQYVRRVAGGVVRARRGPEPKVAVVVGGGSGHYPAFTGYVGQGFADGAVVGNIFTSPSAHYVYSVARHASSGRGVVLSYGNYAGDVINFGIAQEQLEAEGIPTRTVLVTDDVASAPVEKRALRRGIAGDYAVFKILSAAAEEGLDLDAVVAAGEYANARTSTIGVAFDGCTFPGATERLFTVPDGHMSLGLGVHGEPGITDLPLASAREIADLLLQQLVAERPADSSSRIAVIVNGLGRTKWEELFLLWGELATRFDDLGLEPVEPEVGEIITSLDMAGVSLTIVWLDDDLERFWRAPIDTTAFRKGAVAAGDAAELDADAESDADTLSFPAASVASAKAADDAVRVIAAVVDTLRRGEAELGRIDAVAGDGDHGRGMLRGATAALAGAEVAAAEGAGLGSTISHAGDRWALEAGGTSGVLWGTALRAAGATIGDELPLHDDRAVAAVRAFRDTIVRLGKAQPGDKTMVDALEPYLASLETEGDWAAAAAVAMQAALDTAALSPKLGRARPLAEQSVGTPDAGATSFGMIASVVEQQTR